MSYDLFLFAMNEQATPEAIESYLISPDFDAFLEERVDDSDELLPHCFVDTTVSDDQLRFWIAQAYLASEIESANRSEEVKGYLQATDPIDPPAEYADDVENLLEYASSGHFVPLMISYGGDLEGGLRTAARMLRKLIPRRVVAFDPQSGGVVTGDNAKDKLLGMPLGESDAESELEEAPHSDYRLYLFKKNISASLAEINQFAQSPEYEEFLAIQGEEIQQYLPEDFIDLNVSTRQVRITAAKALLRTLTEDADRSEAERQFLSRANATAPPPEFTETFNTYLGDATVGYFVPINIELLGEERPNAVGVFLSFAQADGIFAIDAQERKVISITVSGGAVGDCKLYFFQMADGIKSKDINAYIASPEFAEYVESRDPETAAVVPSQFVGNAFSNIEIRSLVCKRLVSIVVEEPWTDEISDYVNGLSVIEPPDSCRELIETFIDPQAIGRVALVQFPNDANFMSYLKIFMGVCESLADLRVACYVPQFAKVFTGEDVS